MATAHSSRRRRPRARKKVQRLPKAANQPPAAKPPVSIRKLTGELVDGIALVECAKRSLSEQEIGAPEQVALEQALKAFWRVHDGLDELPGADEEDDEDEEDES